MKKISLLMAFAWFFSCFVVAQTPAIQYADFISKTDVQRMNFEIIGKLSNNFLIYKNVKGDNTIAVYDENMRHLQEVPVTFLNGAKNILDVSFITQRNQSYMIYQQQEGDLVYCYAAIVEANGTMQRTPVLLDTTMINYTANSKIYNLITSNSRGKILLFKVSKKDRKTHRIYAKLYNRQLDLLGSKQYNIPMEQDGDYLSSYSVSNNGDLYFLKYNRMKNGAIANALAIKKGVASGADHEHAINFGSTYLDDIKMKLDDRNDQCILASFFTQSKGGNIEGIFAGTYQLNSLAPNNERIEPFSDDLKKKAKTGISKREAVNDYFINNIIVNKDGSFAVGAEVFYANLGGNTWNRWGYWNSPYGWGAPYMGWGFSRMWSPHHFYFSPYYYYSPFFYRSYWWGNYWYDDGRMEFNADNILLLGFNKQAEKVWDNIILKRQRDYQTDATLSYQVMQEANTNSILLNNSGKVSDLEIISYNSEGAIKKNVPIAAGNKKMDFLPRYAKQVSGDEAIVPFRMNKLISFAKLTF